LEEFDMADAVTSQTLQDGPAVAVLNFTNLSDGSGEAAVKKVDVSALSALQAAGNEAACNEVRIEKIVYATSGMVVRLLWDADTDDVCWELPSDESGVLNFEGGGLKNPRSTGTTGDVMFTTVGHSNTDWYSVYLWLRKKYG